MVTLTQMGKDLGPMIRLGPMMGKDLGPMIRLEHRLEHRLEDRFLLELSTRMKEDQELSKKKISSCFCNFIIGKKKSLLVRLHFDNEKSDTTLEERMQ